MPESTPPFMKLQSVSLIAGIWSLLLGIWTLSYIYHVYKRYREKLLKRLFLFILFMNLSVIVFQVAAYLHLADSDTSMELLFNRFVFSMVLSSLMPVLAVYFLFRVVSELNAADLPRCLTRIFYILFAAMICSVLIGMYLAFMRDWWWWLKINDIVVDLLVWLAFLFSLVFYSLIASNVKRSSNRKASLAFFYLYISFFVLWSLSVVLPEAVRYYYLFFTYALFNFIPLIWIPRYYLRYAVAGRGENGLSPTQSFIQTHGITRREVEIINLILAGNSNKEIADTLFISGSTVRNHIYRIYQKLNINSRLQLVNLILQEKGDYEGD